MDHIRPTPPIDRNRKKKKIVELKSPFLDQEQHTCKIKCTFPTNLVNQESTNRHCNTGTKRTCYNYIIKVKQKEQFIIFYLCKRETGSSYPSYLQ